MSEFTYLFTKGKTLSDAKQTAFYEYIGKHHDSIVQIGEYRFDTVSLQQEIILNKCLECEHYQKENCCGGNPYPLVDEQQTQLLDIMPELIKIMPEEFRPIVHKTAEGKANEADVFNKHNTFKSCRDRCMFKIYAEDLPRCAIHYYCLQKGLDPIKYKPYICSLFPIFVIQTSSGEKYVFCHTKENSSFSLYWWTLGNRPCVIKEAAKKVVTQTEYRSKYYYTMNRENMIKDDILASYHPAWIEQKSVMTYFFGEDVYNELDNTMQMKVGQTNVD